MSKFNKSVNAFRALHQNLVYSLVAALLVNLCLAYAASKTQAPCVRSVDYGGSPQIKTLAERARQISNQFYPEVCALLADGKSRAPRRFDICFKKELPNANSAQTRMNRICLNASYIEEWKNDLATFDSLLVHEMAHVAQHYQRPIIGSWLVLHYNAPSWLVEGIADYASFKLGQTNGWRCAECNLAFPDYRDGYSCAAAFLWYLEKTYDDGIVKELNSKLRRGGFSDDCFAKITGKDLQTLWAEFRRTAAFTPSAARMFDLQQSLGFVAGKPPKDVEQRIKTFVDCCLDESVRDLFTKANLSDLGVGSIQQHLAILCYFTQPGGTAEAYITGLKTSNRLPGFSQGEHGTLDGAVKACDLTPAYPVTRSFTANKLGDDGSTYHYSVFRASEQSVWKLHRAWRTGADGSVTEEYSVPQ